MVSDAFSCPYCNTPVTIPAGAVPGQRIPCPRCGEAFPYRPQDDEAPSSRAASTGAAVASTDRPVELRTALPRRANRLVAGIVVGVMVVMAIVGLVWALKTVPDRRSRDRKEPLGYLPRDVDALAVVQVTRAMDVPVGRDFLKLFGLGPGGGGLIELEKWTGLRAEDIDQVVLGLKLLDGRIPPRLTLVVETRQPYDLDALRKAMQGQREEERAGKTLYSFDIGALRTEMWCPTDRILIVGLAPSDLDAVPLTPEPGLNHLSPVLRSLLQDQMSEGSHALLIADTEDWEKKAAPLLVTLVRSNALKQNTALWSSVQRAGLWLRFDEDVQLKAAFRCSDEGRAGELRTYLVESEVVAADAVELSNEQWVILHAETSGERVRQLAKRSFGNLPAIPRK